PPSGAERRAAATTVHLRARHPRLGPTLVAAPTVAADMALLGRRLRDLATGAGAEVVGEVSSLGVDVDLRSGRVRAVTLRRDGRAPVTVRAALVVDASGRSGVVRRRSPHLVPWCPLLRGDELCSAS